jgi:Glycosyl transferase family 1
LCGSPTNVELRFQQLPRSNILDWWASNTAIRFAEGNDTFVVKIYYGICGEGMGHGGRSIALIERLVALGHRVTIFTFADAFKLVTSSGYQLHRIAGLQFGISACGGVAALRSLCDAGFTGRSSASSPCFIRARQVDIISASKYCCAIAWRGCR